jgi:hypothetical protein
MGAAGHAGDSVSGLPTVPRPEPERHGRDEINLTEFPLGLLSDRAARKEASSLRFEAGPKVWEIAGHPRYGLPTASDVEVYVCLMELTQEQDYPVRVQFTRHDLLRRLGWGCGAAKYARLQLAFNRLVGVTIETTNAYYDARDRQWLRRHSFHVLEEYEITDGRHAVSEDEPASWFRWGEAIWQNLQAGYIKTLNVSLFLALQSAISQALYRYLDAKIRDGKTIFRQNLRDLAQQHLGMSRDYWISDIKRKLAPAHEELIAAGFMVRAEYAKTLAGEEMVVYHFPRRRALREHPADSAQHPALSTQHPAPSTQHPAPRAPEAPEPLLQALVEQQVALETARQLLASWPERCARQLAWLPYREGIQNPGGALRMAIEGDWPPPPRWLAEQQRQQQAVKASRRREQEQAQEEETAAAAAAFDAWWAALPETERAPLLQQAQAELLGESPLLTQYYQRHPDRLHAALRPLLQQLAGRWGDDEVIRDP